jgi:hypothetical protein
MVLSRIARMLFYILDKGNSRYGNENHPNYVHLFYVRNSNRYHESA